MWVWLWCILLLFPRYVYANQSMIDIQILSKHHPQTVSIETHSRIFFLNSSTPSEFEFSAPLNQDITVTVNKRIKRTYRGTIRAYWTGDEYILENRTPLEMYVAGVVIGELGIDAEPALMKALAILARTYALKIRQREVLSDLAYHQVFHGYDHYAQSIFVYTRATRDLVLKQRGKLADALYHAECGSANYHAGEFWPSNDYQPPKPLPADVEKGMPWQVVLSDDQIHTVFPEATQLKRVASVPVMIDLGAQKKNAEAFRLVVNREFGWNTIPSNEFEIVRQVRGWLLKGRGRGHLVGLCQRQAGQLARKGWRYDQILGLFYPEFIVLTRRVHPIRAT